MRCVRRWKTLGEKEILKWPLLNLHSIIWDRQRE